MAVDPNRMAAHLSLVGDTGRLLQKNSGGGDSGGMDPWQTSVESRLASIDNRFGRLEDRLDSNFKVTWTGILAGFLLTWGGLITGFLLIIEKLP